MTAQFRVIDTGIRPAREHIAFDQALIDLHKDGKVPDTLRFLQFRPTALVGRHQALAREVRLDYCTEHGIEVGRRVTGGGAIYLDQGQLGWELVFKKQSLGLATLPEVTRKICEAAAAGIASLGVNAAYRPYSDIEVDGRKISGTGGFFDGDTLFYQGTVLVDMDPSQMINVLNIPQAEHKAQQKEKAQQRVVTLTDLLGSAPEIAQIKQALVDAFAQHLGIASGADEISEIEETLARQYHDDEIGTEEFVHSIDDPASDPGVLSATHACPGGNISAHLRLEGPGRGRIREVLVSGDFFVAPGRTVLDLEATLRGVQVAEVAHAVDEFFARTSTELMTVKPADFRIAIESALSQAA